VQLETFSGITYTPTLIVNYGASATGQNYWLTRYNLDEDKKVRYFTPHEDVDKWREYQWYREDQYIFPKIAKEAAKIVANGGHIGLGAHGEIQGIGTHWELWMIASGGMPTHDALRVGTIMSADAIGLSKDIGSLEPGKLADLLVLDANPLADIRNTNTIRYVMKNGRLYEGNTLKEIYPRQKTIGEMWWWKLDPPDSMIKPNSK
jgi:hypothetical protein